MTSIVKLTAISGVQNESPLCYFLQVDEFRFLLDCGLDENFDREYLNTLQRYVKQIDAILLSHPDPLHLGALPYLIGKLELRCPVYATTPIYKMGQMFMYDVHQSKSEGEEFQLFSLDDVDMAFEMMVQLKYSQNVSLKGKGNGLVITPYAAGHMLGGTMWKIVKDGEEDILYAVDYNHKKERHLDGAVLESLGRPSLLITDSLNALNVPDRRKERDQALVAEILRTMRRGGNMLIAVDTAGRVLELSQLLDQLWENEDLSRYNIALLNYVGKNVIEFAKGQVEWMSEKILKMFEEKRDNPFNFKHIIPCHSIAELEDKVPYPKVVLASPPDLECGLARELFISWATDEKNSIVFTSRSSPGTLARDLIDNPKKDSVVLEVRKRVQLEGEELEQYKQNEAEVKQKQVKLEQDLFVQQAGAGMKDPSLSINLSGSIEGIEDSDSEMETEPDVTSPVASKQLKIPKHDLMTGEALKSRPSFFKQSRAFPMFPCREEKMRFDDYGDLIRHEDYMIKDPYEDRMDDGSYGETSRVANIRDNTAVTVPTKCVSTMQNVEIKCTVTFIDFEGRSDGDSIKRILTLVKPRQLIIVHGMPDATEHLAEYCRNNVSVGIPSDKVFAPKPGECVDCTSERHIYQVKLKDNLVSSLRFARAQDAELAWVDGILSFHSDAGNKDINYLATNELSSVSSHIIDSEHGAMETANMLLGDREVGQDEKVPVLDALPSYRVSGHRAVFINEPRLTDFKQVLTQNGIQAEFSGGVLICNSIVAVRRSEAGKISLEGALCDDFYTVRKLLYEQYAIV